MMEHDERLDEFKYDLMGAACSLGRADVVEYLIANGVDVTKPLKERSGF